MTLFYFPSCADPTSIGRQCLVTSGPSTLFRPVVPIGWCTWALMGPAAAARASPLRALAAPRWALSSDRERAANFKCALMQGHGCGSLNEPLIGVARTVFSIPFLHNIDFPFFSQCVVPGSDIIATMGGLRTRLYKTDRARDFEHEQVGWTPACSCRRMGWC